MPVSIKEQLEFIDRLSTAYTAIVDKVTRNEDVRRLLNQTTIHNLDVKDRKMVNGLLRNTVCEQTGYTANELEMITVRFHENTTVGIMSTTESDVFELIYYYDLGNLADQLKVIDL
jgi:hypothetical protein